MLDAVGALWTAGLDIDWASMRAHDQRRRIPLPTYPFERTEYRLPRLRSGLAPSPGPRAEAPQGPLAAEHVPSTQDGDDLEQIVARQLAVMEAQLEVLDGAGVPASVASEPHV